MNILVGIIKITVGGLVALAGLVLMGVIIAAALGALLGPLLALLWFLVTAVIQ